MKSFLAGLVLGALIVFVCFSLFTEQTDNFQESNIRFLVNLEKGHAVDYKNLSDGVYKVGDNIDKYTTVLTQIIPLGDIPVLVRDIPLATLDVARDKDVGNGYLYKCPPTIEKDW